MSNRIIGFDLARAYAILGMFIVNFNTVFGSLANKSLMGKFLNLFNGNSSSAFVILAGMGVALMTNRKTYTDEEKKRLSLTVIKRSWVLFFAGLLLFLWWPADILHFYGGYMHIAALLLFVPKKYCLLAAISAVAVFHVLLAIIPYENGWNFDTLSYAGFWTAKGFLRNTFYNGWNPIFPWIAYFFFGMWLGRLDWNNSTVRKNLFFSGLSLYLFTVSLQMLASNGYFAPNITFYVSSDYIPPFLPFMLGTSGFTLMLLVVCMYTGEMFRKSKAIQTLAKTGQMTLTHYISHLTIGIIILMVISGKTFTGSISNNTPVKPLHILVFSISFFLSSALFSKFWSRKYTNGPLETLMRKITNT